MKLLSQLSYSILFLIGLSGCQEECKADLKLTVGMSADYPPFEYFSDGKIVGFEVELAQLIAKELAACIEFKDMPFDSIIGALQANRISFSISAISATESRKKSVDFSDNYHSSRPVIITLKDNGITDESAAYHHTLGVQMGTSYESDLKKLQKKNPQLKIQSLNKLPDLLQDLWSKRIQGIVVGNVEGESLLKKYDVLTAIPTSMEETTFAIALPKNSPLRTKVNEALAKIKQSLEYKNLYAKYFS